MPAHYLHRARLLNEGCVPAIFEHPHTIRPDEIDVLGHANNLVYLRWMIAAAVAHSTAQGWPPELYQQLGCGFVVRRHEIDYLRPAFEGEEIVVRTWVASMRKAGSQRRYHIFRRKDDQQLAAALTDWAFVDYSKGLPKRIPPEVSGAFEVVVG
jgi:acyl-CoA thioester hydrolase